MSIANEILRLQTAKADIKTAIENKGVTVGDGTIDTYAEKINEISGGEGDYEQGFEDGKNSVVDMGRLCKEIRFTSLNVFGNNEVVVNLDNATSLGNFCYTSIVNTTVEHLTINCPNLVTNCAGVVRCSGADPYLKRLTLNVDTSQSTNFLDMIRNQTGLEIIDGYPINCSSSTNSGNIFFSCTALKEVRFVANSIRGKISFQYNPSFSTDSKQSIFDGLATVETAQTLTLHNNLKILQSQVDSANAKGWTVAGGKVVSEEEYYA